MNKTSLKGKTAAQRFRASYVTTNYDDILDDPLVDLVMITTRHDSHTDLALNALKSGKNVFVEKPLAVNKEQLEELEQFFRNKKDPPVLMVGFNRRFSKYSFEIRKHTEKRINPLFIHYRMNAGHLPLDHWVHENGGRIIGECCHIIDLMTFFTGCKIASLSYEKITPATEHFSSTDNKSIILKYTDGSLAAIDYLSIGSSLFQKEYMEVHFDEKTIVLDDYRDLRGYGIKMRKISSRNAQKGHREELERLYSTLAGKEAEWPIPLWDMIQTTKTTFLIQ
jgi:predicted dehydrogenase